MASNSCALPRSNEAEAFGSSQNVFPDTTPGLAVLALLLALVLGFSAADIQHQRAQEAASAQGHEQTQGVLDGRGKWAGYL